MNNRLIYYLAICLILLLNVALPQNTNAETGHLYHVNPAYKQLAAGKRAPLNKGLAKRSKTVTTCSSYDSFADVLDGYIQGHNTSFQIALQYDFLFFQVEDIINRAIDEVFDGDDYLALSYVSYSSSWSGDNGSVTITFTFDFLTTADEEEEITQRLQEIMFSFSGIIIPGMNNEEMGKEIHDWIVLNVAYDMSLTEHSAHAALFLGTTVCQGYSLLMTRMLSEVNIESKIVVSESMNHAWNLVNLCDTWYHVDATWDDPVPDTTGYVRYDYYNLSDSEMGQDHTFSGGYPACPYSYIEGDCGTSANPDPLIISAQSDTASGNAPLNINLGVTVESGASPYTFQWNFGDGTPGSSQQNPEHTYFDAGTYTAEVTVTDDNGNIETASVQITVATPQSDLIWQSSKATAVSMALTQGKKILLIGGRETCGNCQYMKYTACESISPPIKSLIEQSFIPWFCDIDNSTEWYSYASGLDSFTLPLICVIDPTNETTYQNRTTGIQDFQEFYSWLFMMTGANPDPLIISAQSDTASGNAPLNVNLGVTVESGASPHTFQWNFGDGTPGSSQQNPEHTYFDAGTYTAEVTVTDDNGTIETASVQITVATPQSDLIWQSSKATAVSMALTQGKKILLIGGRETCGNCQYMKYTACESISPPIKSLIEQSFIPWFCDVDNSDEWHAYASGSGSYTLPLICVIDPENGDAHQDRTTGIQDIQDFYTRLFQMKGDAGTAYETKILTEASPDITLPTGGTSRVYGSSSVNHVTIESGANATLVNFPGSNTIIIEADSNLFSVYRSGATVIFEGTDGTKLTMPASTTAQTIIFNNKSFKLKINSVSIMLGDQLIDTTSSSIIIENNSLTQTQVSQLYIPIFGRASEGEGNEYWRTECTDMVTLATEMLNSPVASNYFGSMLDDNQSFVECVYFTIVSKTYEDDRDGIDYWVAELNARKTKGEVVVALIDAIRDPANAGDAQDCFNNKVTVSNYCADTIASFTDTATFCYFIDDVTADPASVSAAKNKIDTYATSISSNYTTNSLGMTFVSIHPGTFMMGSIEDELGREGYGADETQHQVTLTSAYYLQTTEVTQGQWQAIMGSNPSTHSTSGENYPVETVTWNQAQEFISKLNQRGEGIYALPTEAQWEYAARAGTSTPFHTGGCLLTDQANIGGPFPYGECPTRDGIYDLMPVASFPPNAWGLYDMHGNVSEWCQDVYGQYPSDAVGDPIGPGEGPSRVVRGGSWVDTPDSCRSAYRNYSYPCSTCFVFGLRLTYSPDPQ